ncbi:MAG TPA: hypothetical protein VFP54_05600 [Acidimicrobiales bacterium]|nr:hypothetical protein [Acidimicrobiales bacterium]
MTRSSIARRYLPLAAVVAVQALIIAVVPSTAPATTGVAASGGAGTGYSLGGSSTPGAASATGGSIGSDAGGAGGLSSTPGAGAGSAGGAAGGAQAVSGASASGDTSHCVQGRQFDPGLDYYAPPCTPGKPGAPVANNGGATYQGVTDKQITVVDYVSNYGAEVNAILSAEGLLETYANAQVLDKAWTTFINAHYQLWGRSVKIITYQGQCTSVPPDYQCLIPEMDSIVSTYHPYAVVWNTTLCSACFAELARNKVVAIGGSGFSDAFSNANAPYFYSTDESATRTETAFAQFWCNQLSSKNVPARKVKFAGTQNPAQNFNGQTRDLGVISTNDPDNENTVQNVLVPELNKDCGDGGSIAAHHYYYSQDINTAAQQVNAGISAMDTTTNPATDVLCLCDPVAPEFLYEGEQQHNYYPENLIASDQGMDLDSTAQNYGPGSNNGSSLACPTPNVGCEYDDAFGLSTTAAEDPENQQAGVKVFQSVTSGATPPVTPITATTVWEDFNLLASLIENTGPGLTPARMQAAAPSMGTRGGGTTGHYEVGFAPGDWHWTQDTRVVFWSRDTKSSYNGQPGTYVQIEGTRFGLGQFPNLPDGPPIPSPRP